MYLYINKLYKKTDIMGCGCKKNKIKKPASTPAGTVINPTKPNVVQKQQEALVNEIINKINKTTKK